MTMNTPRNLKAVLNRCLVLTMLMSPAVVVAIPCNTGVTGSALTCGTALLGAGAPDSHWGLGNPFPTAPSGTLITALPTTFSPAFANVNSVEWLSNGPDSGWVTPSALSEQAELGGQYVYHTTFTGDNPFAGRFSSDNELLGVFLNNTLLAGFPLNGPADFGIWRTPFNIIGGLNTGPNTLDFVVRNRGASCGVVGLPLGCNQDLNTTVTGFRAEFSAVPEPGIWLLFASGLAGLAAYRKKITGVRVKLNA